MFNSKKLCNHTSHTAARPPPKPPQGCQSDTQTQNYNHTHCSKNSHKQTTNFSPPSKDANDHDPPQSTTTWRVLKEYFLRRKYAGLKPNECAKILTDEMKQFFKEYQNARPDVYWHRKSGQVVLAVLLVYFKGEYRFTRGINSELSLPSGTVCAERAAITAALSQYLEISRSDFLAIAVFSPNQPNPIRPCGVCREWLSKIEEASPTFTVISFTSNKFDELLEHCPIPFLEEAIGDIPSDLREPAWTCKCGYRLNGPKQAYCALCKQSRFNFKHQLQNHRLGVLNAIAKLQSLSSGHPFRQLTHPELSQRIFGATGKAQVHSTAYESDDWEDQWEGEDDKNHESRSEDELFINGSNPKLSNSNTLNLSNTSFASKIAILCNISRNTARKTLRELVSLQFVSPDVLLSNDRERDASSSSGLKSNSSASSGPEIPPNPPHYNLLTKSSFHRLSSTSHPVPRLAINIKRLPSPSNSQAKKLSDRLAKNCTWVCSWKPIGGNILKNVLNFCYGSNGPLLFIPSE